MPRPIASIFLFFTAALLLGTDAHAQTASAVFNGSQNMDQGLASALNNITGYVPFLPLGSAARSIRSRNKAAVIQEFLGDGIRMGRAADNAGRTLRIEAT